MSDVKIQRAIISLTDKSGIEDFAKALVQEFGVEIISTGGTARMLEQAGVPVTPIDKVTGFPEMMDGRVKTLHPNVHGGMLARRDLETHMQDARDNNIKLIDMVVVNLYAFEQTIAKEGVSYQDAVEHIDIGGPSMLRSAAKNHDSVTVVTNPASYDSILAEMRANNGTTTLETRKKLALEVFRTTSAYDNAIYYWMLGELGSESGAGSDAVGESGAAGDSGVAGDSSAGTSAGGAGKSGKSGAGSDEKGAGKSNKAVQDNIAFAQDKRVMMQKAASLRYGENSHQKAAFYKSVNVGKKPCAQIEEVYTLAHAKQLQGKELSYNNYLDADAAWAACREFGCERPSCVIIKHLTPCGIAQADNLLDAYRDAWKCDTISAFGGVMAFNQVVTRDVAHEIVEVNKQFIEVVIAPSYEDGALEIFAQKENARILQTGGINPAGSGYEIRAIEGGFVVQELDSVGEDPATFTIPTKTKPSKEQMDELLFAWKCCKSVKSNAIVIAKGTHTVGIGGGQPNRVNSARIAVEQAGELARGAVAASDAFLPFPDTLEALRDAGVTALIQPGGSIRDELSIECANKAGIAMVFTGHRHFRH